jgi:branched-chain amino acid transport system ATP-binding protein
MNKVSQKPAILSLSAVTAGYGDVQVLWGIDLVVPEGEIVSIVGPNVSNGSLDNWGA